MVKLLAVENANTASRYIENMLTRANVVSLGITNLYSSNISESELKNLIKTNIYSQLKDEQIFSAYIAVEPNKLFENTPKGYSYYVYRDGVSLKTDELNDYDVYNTGDYYANTKKTLKAYMTEPYQYQLSTGELVWLITISQPILSENNEFLGVSNCDILASTIEDLSYDVGDYKTSQFYLLNEDANYLSHSENDFTYIGQKYGTSNTQNEKTKNIIDTVNTNVENGTAVVIEGLNYLNNKQSLMIQTPVNIKGLDQILSAGFVITNSEIQEAYIGSVVLVLGISIIGVILVNVLVSLALKKSLIPVRSILSMTEGIKGGNLTQSITVNSTDELGLIARDLNETIHFLNGYITEISRVLGEISKGNMNVDIRVDFVGDFKNIKDSMDNIAQNMNNTLKRISVASEQVNSGAMQVADGSQALASGATEQASTIQQLSASIEEIAAQIQVNTSNAQEADATSTESGKEVVEGNGMMQQMVSAVQNIKESFLKISGIIKVIDDIAFQTNILALNAAVEAARAGTSGKGFAVVAEEVRNLAAKSAEAAKQTTELINNSQKNVVTGQEIAKNTAESFVRISEKSMLVEQLIKNIATASSEQSLAITQVKEGVEQISSVVQMNAATAEESSAASEELASQATLLRKELSNFNLKL
jgi:methyl-accepting chemotaxis protein